MRHVGGSKGGLKSLGGPLGRMRFLERIKKDLQSLHQLGTSALPVISSLPKLKNYVTVSAVRRFGELWGSRGGRGAEVGRLEWIPGCTRTSMERTSKHVR